MSETVITQLLSRYHSTWRNCPLCPCTIIHAGLITGSVPVAPYLQSSVFWSALRSPFDNIPRTAIPPPAVLCTGSGYLLLFLNGLPYSVLKNPNLLFRNSSCLVLYYDKAYLSTKFFCQIFFKHFSQVFTHFLHLYCFFLSYILLSETTAWINYTRIWDGCSNAKDLALFIFQRWSDQYYDEEGNNGTHFWNDQ